VFNFGTVLYELLSGRRPFSGGNSIATMAAIMHKDPAPLDAPPALQQIVQRCLAKSPDERFQSMGAVSQALAGHFVPEESNSESACPSIAVLPFANMSGGQENDYFSEGLAEEIINALGQIPGLRVTARTSAFALRGKEQDIRKIAHALKVKTILEGSVRRAGNRIRVVAQLINPENGYHLWSQRYEREMADVFELQDEIVQAIATALNVTLAGAPALVQQYKLALPAYEALLRARHHLGRLDADSMPRAMEAFEQAIALDPGFPLPHCEYARHFASLAMWGLMPADQVIPVIREHATKALELDPSIPEGHAMLGVVAGLYDYNWQEAKIKFRHARARVPVSPTVRWLHAMAYLLPTGRLGEAIQEIEDALQRSRTHFRKTRSI
jgi:serine/threonine-protein kinase